jgi:cytochrome b6-f complex iron-sulfur subunit
MAEAKSEKPPAAKGASAATFDVVAQYPPPGVTRRSFLMSWAGVAWGTFAAANGVGGLAMLRFMLPNVLFEPPQVFKAGKLDDYEWDKPDERYKTSQKAWLVKTRGDYNKKAQFYALDTTCTHLGCTPNVLFSESKIKCPCHGSGFRFTGINFEGPAPRPLERYKVFIDPVDGQIVIDKTKKFHYETGPDGGDWKQPESYIDLSNV